MSEFISLITRMLDKPIVLFIVVLGLTLLYFMCNFKGDDE